MASLSAPTGNPQRVDRTAPFPAPARRVSSGREPPPPALAEPYVTVSRHTARTCRCVSSGSHMFVFSSLTCPADGGAFAATVTTPALDRRRLRWFGLSACTARPEGQPPSLAQHGRSDDLLTSPSLPFRTHNRACGCPANGSPTPFTAGIRLCPPGPVGPARRRSR